MDRETARQSATEFFEQTSFLYGGNAIYIENLHARYELDRASVDADWREFFDGLRDDGASIRKSAEGASWKKTGWPLTVNGELTSALDGNWRDSEKAIGEKLQKKIETLNVEVSAADLHRSTRDSIRALMMIRAYRMRGHLHADLDPLGLAPARDHEELHPATYGFTETDLDRGIFIDGALGLEFATIREMLDILRRTYCATIGYEFMHISDPEQKAWLQERSRATDRASAWAEASAPSSTSSSR